MDNMNITSIQILFECSRLEANSIKTILAESPKTNVESALEKSKINDVLKKRVLSFVELMRRGKDEH